MVVEPVALALFRGDADPAPPARRPTMRVPRALGALLPSGRVGLVQVADIALAVVLYGITVSTVVNWNARVPGQPVGESLVHLTAVGVALPLALRDRRPLAAWRVAAVLLPVVIWVTIRLDGATPPYPAPLIIAYLLVLYSVAVRCERRITMSVWAVTVLTAWIVNPNSMALVTLGVSVAVVFGYNVRVRRSATARLVEEERRTRQAEGAQAVLEERARIARELHDVVAHHMSVIAIQAEAVPLKAAGDAAQLEAGLAEIRQLSLEAIAELRQVLGVLRDPEGRADTAPQPGLDRIDELVANARAAGLAVLVKRSGSLEGLPPAVGLSAYRIVQESLSNVMRHAPGAGVAVDLGRSDGELVLHIVNGPGTGAVAEPGAVPGSGGGGRGTGHGG
ncbi:sensor histidine kinase, partial [Nonomuraea aridisoli]